MLRLDRAAYDAICAHAFDEYPLEMCGLIAGPPGEEAARWFYPCRNDAESARVYTVNPMDFMAADDDADDRGWVVNGVVHSHTHSEPYPSPTDVRQAPDPDWHYVIVSLKRDEPEVRSYRIVDGAVTESPVTVVGRSAQDDG